MENVWYRCLDLWIFIELIVYIVGDFELWFEKKNDYYLSFFCIVWFINEGLNNILINSVFLFNNFINNIILLIVDGKEL